MAKNDDLQAAADSGELKRANLERDYKIMQENFRQMIDKRWVVTQVVEMAKASHISMPPDDFKAMCEYIDTFVRG